MSPGGAIGYTHFVFERVGDRIVTSLVEGPRGPQVRCQDPALPCSYLDLKELADSGAPVPEQLQMTREELVELVSELDQANRVAEQYRDVNAACGAGYLRTTDQTPNMGAHFLHTGLIFDGVFDVGAPEIILYGSADPTIANTGQCESGSWSGGDVVLTGLSYILPTQLIGDKHPQGFTGPIDNWHVHYELCSGPETAGRTATRGDCADSHGVFLDKFGWMIHAWIDPSHDNQLGVFGMWNHSIWPATDPQSIKGTRVIDGKPEPGVVSLVIENFAFTEVSVSVGDTVRVVNADSVTHTFTAGVPGYPTGAFDSGFIPTGGIFELTFDQPGTVNVFCSLHPNMVLTITIDS